MNSQIYMIDGGCYYDLLPSLNANWDQLPQIKYWNRKEGKIYDHMDKFDEKGLKRMTFKV